MKRALLSGISGQDGSHLAELLLQKGYEVHGIIRRSSSFNTGRIDHIFDQLHLHYGDMSDGSALANLLHRIEPDEIYNLGAQSHVRVSFDAPIYTADVTGLGTLRLLEAIREVGIKPRFYNAASSEMFGSSPPPQSEQTAFSPRSPYACSKVFAFNCTVNYREAYGFFACNGILFNHEGERRSETFVSRKITRAAGRIKLKLQGKLYLGNLDAKRDWGYAKDYVEAMWLMLEPDSPDDFVIATGQTHSVREFLDEAFGYLNLDWHEYVEIDPRYFRPAEVDVLQGDASKARRELGWEPKTNFKQLVRLMVDSDLELAEGEKILKEQHG